MKRKLFFLAIWLMAFGLAGAQDLQYQTALMDNGSTSANSRAPQGSQRYQRSVYLITATEMAASGLVNGDVLRGIGFEYTIPLTAPISGNIKIYLQNTTDIANNKSTAWATAVTGMTEASNGSITIPAAATLFQAFSGGSNFTYTGGGLYVAFEYQNPTGALATTGNTALCSTTLTGGLKGAQSNSALPTTLTASNWRPKTFLAKAVACATLLSPTMTAYTDNSATISWIGVLNAQIEYGISPYTQGSGGTTATATSSSSQTISGLMPGKAYDVYLRKDCGGGVYSAWTKVTVGTSNSAPITSFPYSMNFETAPDQAFIFNLGWDNNPVGNVGGWSWYKDDTTDGDPTNDFAHSPVSFIGSSIATTAQNAWSFSPPLQLEAGNTYNISYYYRTFSTAATTAAVSFSVGINSSKTGTGATILANHPDYNNLTYVQGNVQFTPSTSGNYYLGFHNNTPARTGITTTNYVFIDTVSISKQLGTHETELESLSLSIYPNPVADILTVEVKDKLRNISIYDLSGRKMNVPVAGNTVEVRHLKPGSYLIAIETDQGSASAKFIKK
ncbi:T9SS type A sorting domain-containing protein [Chryseobacterium lacus]|uniref:T9SS type A sorting domain-containing protein n=1 Tax=Chryseobacterium lacus TaxID=2058346 RepID=UPI000F85D0BD|nr:T9SS type A sorting domain-containing protein [Chryseobacterium lacus]RST26728.1 T9SS C-terminal target domain-containing protein [Chryseobacterium lacus]